MQVAGIKSEALNQGVQYNGEVSVCTFKIVAYSLDSRCFAGYGRHFAN